MNLRLVGRVLSLCLGLCALFMLAPLVAGLLDGEDFGHERFRTLAGFSIAAGVTGLGALALWLVCRGAQGEFFRREGVLAVAAAWYLAVVVGALPFWLSGSLALDDALFESASGLTTTGASVFGAAHTPALSELPSSLHFWRALSHWLGGIGIVVVFILLLPLLGTTEKRLFQAEVAGISKEGLRPRVQKSASTLVAIYSVITIAIAIAYWLFGMRVFDALCHSFGTIATGGFSTRNASIGAFDSIGIEVVCILGMLASGTNFGLYYEALGVLRGSTLGERSRGRLARLRAAGATFWRDGEFRLYIGLWAAATVAILVVLGVWRQTVADPMLGQVHDYGSVGEGLRSASFATASLATSTGFANRDFLWWPLAAQMLLVALMLHGGCSGSTSGGLKVGRLLVVVQLAGRGFRRFLRPRRVEPAPSLGPGRSLDPDLLDRTLSFIALWFLTMVVASLALLLLSSADPLSAFTSVLSCMGNIGPGITEVLPGSVEPVNALGLSVGPYGSYGNYPSAAKLTLALVMVLGRLELYTPIAVLLPSFWRK